MLVTLLGIVIELRAEHPQKAAYSIVDTLFGMVTEVKLLHPSNKDVAILVTLFGMATEVRPLQRQYLYTPLYQQLMI